jgi:hypothetical protein
MMRCGGRIRDVDGLVRGCFLIDPQSGKRHNRRPLGVNFPAITNCIRCLATRDIFIRANSPAKGTPPERTGPVDRIWMTRANQHWTTVLPRLRRRLFDEEEPASLAAHSAGTFPLFSRPGRLARRPDEMRLRRIPPTVNDVSWLVLQWSIEQLAPTTGRWALTL